VNDIGAGGLANPVPANGSMPMRPGFSKHPTRATAGKFCSGGINAIVQKDRAIRVVVGVNTYYLRVIDVLANLSSMPTPEFVQVYLGQQFDPGDPFSAESKAEADANAPGMVLKPVDGFRHQVQFDGNTYEVITKDSIDFP
jgi:hypothetical protein